MNKRQIAIVIAAAGVPVTLAAADVQLLTANRFIGSGPETRTTTAFGAWNESVSYVDPFYDGAGSASQISSITSSRVALTSSVSGFDGRQVSGGGGASTLRLVIQVTEPLEYFVRTSFSIGPRFSEPQLEFNASLTGPAGVVFQRRITSWFNMGPLLGTVDVVGTLQPGTYTFETRTSVYAQATGGGAGSPSGILNLDADLFLPTPSAGLLLALGRAWASRRRR